MTVPDFSDPRPVYVQIADDLREQIRAGKYAPGDKLPTVRTLATEVYHVVPGTIRDALDVLRHEGIVESRSTRGTYVMSKPREPEPSPEFRALEEQVRQLKELMEQRLDEVEARLDEYEKDRDRDQ